MDPCEIILLMGAKTSLSVGLHWKAGGVVGWAARFLTGTLLFNTP